MLPGERLRELAWLSNRSSRRLCQQAGRREVARFLGSTKECKTKIWGLTLQVRLSEALAFHLR
jgi:hypothetical protein